MPFLDLPPLDPGFEFYVATHGITAGISQTDGIQIIPRGYVRIGSVQVGGQWRNISSSSASGVAALFVKFTPKLGQTRLEAAVAYRIRTGTKGTADVSAWEFSGSVKRDFGPIGLKLYLEYSPDDFGDGRSLYVELGGSYPLGKVIVISANLGRRERETSPEYTSFNAGISMTVAKGLSLDARYYATDRAELGPRYQDRIVISARLVL